MNTVLADSRTEAWEVTAAALDGLLASSFEVAPLDTFGVLLGQPRAVNQCLPLRRILRWPQQPALGVALGCYGLGSPLTNQFCVPEFALRDTPQEFFKLPDTLLGVVCVPWRFLAAQPNDAPPPLTSWCSASETKLLAILESPLAVEVAVARLQRHKEMLERILPRLDDPEARQFVQELLANLESILPQLGQGSLNPLACLVCLAQNKVKVPLRLAADGPPPPAPSPQLRDFAARFSTCFEQAHLQPPAGRISAMRRFGELLRHGDTGFSPGQALPQQSSPLDRPAAAASAVRARIESSLQATQSRIQERMNRLLGAQKPGAGSGEATPSLSSFPGDIQSRAGGQPLMGASADLCLEPRLADWTGYVRAHRGEPVVKELAVRYDGVARLEDLRLRVDFLEYAHPYEQVIPQLDRRTPLTVTDIALHANLAALRRVTERLTGRVTITLANGQGQPLQVVHGDIPVLAFNECPVTTREAELIACFVQPTDPGVIEVTKLATPHLQTLNDSAAFCGYQVPNPTFIDNMVKAVFQAIQRDLDVKYINPPPSYEIGERGLQRLRTPSQVVFREHQGTCFDLSVLFASCLEHIGLNPLIFLIRGHAFFGYFTQDTTFTDALHANWSRVSEALKAGQLIAINSTNFTEGGTYGESKKTGARYLAEAAEFQCVLDVQQARKQGFLPMPLEDNR